MKEKGEMKGAALALEFTLLCVYILYAGLTECGVCGCKRGCLFRDPGTLGRCVAVFNAFFVRVYFFIFSSQYRPLFLR